MLNQLNDDYITRDNIIFGGYHPSLYSGGIRRFKCNRETLQKLVEMNFAALDECQNESPSIQEFLKYTEDLKCGFEFICYAVSPERFDYRVSVEGIDIRIFDQDYDTLSFCVETFCPADEFNLDHVNNSYYLHAWWD